VPGHRVHAYADRQFFGKVYWKMHREMDWPVFYVHKNHRSFFHDILSVYAIAQKFYPGDPRAVESGFLHIQTDEACTRNPVYRAQLELLANADVRKRKRQCKKKSKQKKDVVETELGKLSKDMKKLVKIKELQRYLLDH